MQIKAKHDDLRSAQRGEGKGKAMLPEILEQISGGRGGCEGANGLLRPRRIESIKFKLVLGNHCRERDRKVG